MRLGADVEQLDRLASLLDRSAGELRGIRAELTGAVQILSWQGPDAHQFTEIWRLRHDRQIEVVAAQIQEASATALKNTAEQRSVSTDTVGSRAGILGLLGGPEIERAPERVQIVQVDLGGGDALRVDLGVTVRVEHLDGAMIRVTEIMDVSAGPTAGAGATAELYWGDRKVGDRADVSIAAAFGANGSNVWVIPETDLRNLLISRSRDLIGGTSVPAVRSAIDHIPGADSLAHAMGFSEEWDALSAETPRPTSVGMAVGGSLELSGLIGVDGSGSTGAAPTLGIALAGNERVGLEVDTSTRALTATFAVSGAAAISRGPGAPEGAAHGGDVQARLSFDTDGKPLRLDVTTQTDDGQTVERQRVSVDLHHPDVVEAAVALKEALTGSGDVAAATNSVLVTGALRTSEQVSTYEFGEAGHYGFDIGVASAEVTYQDLHRIP